MSVGSLERWWAAGRARLRELPPRIVLAIGYAAFLVYAHPGYMSNDSVVQLLEARSREYSDAHPPIMAAIWSVLDAIVSGPILMLVLQSVLLLGGVYALLRRALGDRAGAWCAIGLLLFPPVLTPMAVIWKDSQMAAWLVAGVAAMTSERPRTRWIGLAMIAIGTAYRHNAFAASVPIVGLLFAWRPGMRWWKRYAISTVVTIVVVAAAFSTTRLLAVHHQRITPAFGDIVGVLTYTHERSDDDLRHVLRGTPLHVTTDIQAHARAIYSPRNYYQVSRGPNRLFDDPVTEEHWQNLDRAWREIVTSDLGAYFTFRWSSYRELLGLSDEPLFAPVWNLFLEGAHQMAAIRHNAMPSRSQFYVGHVMAWLAFETPLFRPYLYVVLALLLVIWLCRDRLTFALLASGLLYELSYFPAAGAPDFRYSHWMIVATCLAAILLVGARLRARRA
ncbi:MAG TPA: hypothetical protein VFQ53_37940 [Kofleriaceae bacterium]|nr:hypothetical protein [Kofleriaceae bacterium]